MAEPILTRARRTARRLTGRSSDPPPPPADSPPSAESEQPADPTRGAAATPAEVAELRADLAAALELRAREEEVKPHGR